MSWLVWCQSCRVCSAAYIIRPQLDEPRKTCSCFGSLGFPIISIFNDWATAVAARFRVEFIGQVTKKLELVQRHGGERCWSSIWLCDVGVRTPSGSEAIDCISE